MQVSTGFFNNRLRVIYQGRVVRKPVNVNPGLNVNWSITFYKCFSPLKFGVVWDYYRSKLKDKQYKENASTKNYKTEIKILANSGLA